MKRRFVFIDIAPPGRAHADDEQGIAVYRALLRLSDQRLDLIAANESAGRAAWRGVLSVGREEERDGGATRVSYRLDVEQNEAKDALDSFWRIFSAIRVYRQLGTAQAEAVYAAAFAGRLIGLAWPEALDFALADTLADQLQVLNRDEQRVLLAFLEHAGNPKAFAEAAQAILREQPAPRQKVHLARFAAALPGAREIKAVDELKPELLREIFDLGRELLIEEDADADEPRQFAGRLRGFSNERGL